MSKPGYLSVNITPARRLNLDDARFIMRQPKASDIEVIDFAIAWLLVTAERLKVDARRERRVRRAIKESADSDRVHNEQAPTTVRAHELEPATRHNQGRRSA